MQAVVHSLEQACTAAQNAEQLLSPHADKLGMMMAADGEAASSSEVATVVEELQAILDKRQQTLAAVQAAMVAFARACTALRKSTAVRDLQPLVDLQRVANLPFNRMWNQAKSELLQLPDSVLHLIARKAGKPARLTCRRIVDVFDSPGSIVSLGNTEGLTQMQMTARLTTVANSWRWREQVKELRLPNNLVIRMQERVGLAAALPNLQHLVCCGADGREHGTAPVWQSVTALTCIVPQRTPLVLPFQVPNLQRLQLQSDPNWHHRYAYGAIRQLNLAAPLQPLNALTHLRVDRVTLQPQAQQELAATLLALSPSLASLQLLGGARLQFHLTVLTQLQLQYLGIGSPDWSHLPPLQQMPHLRHLELLGSCNATGETAQDLQRLLQGGSRRLQSLTLPELLYADDEDRMAASIALCEAWPRLPALTSLVLPGNITRSTAELPVLRSLPPLQRLSLSLWAEALAHLSCLQPITSLTHLQLSFISNGQHIGPAARDATATLAHLTQLRSLRVACHTPQLGLLCVRHAALLPQLHELDLAGLREPDDMDLVALRPLLAPGCHVRRLKLTPWSALLTPAQPLGGGGNTAGAPGGRAGLMAELRLKMDVVLRIS